MNENNESKNSVSQSPNNKAVSYLLDYLKSKLHLYYEVRIDSLDTDVLPEVVALKTTESNKQTIILNGNHPLVKEALSTLDSHSNIQTLANDLEKLETEWNKLERQKEWCAKDFLGK